MIQQAIAPGTVVETAESEISARLPGWGATHRTVGHAAGEFARDEDGDGFSEVQVDTVEGSWTLFRSRPRPDRGISQERLPLYQGFFEFVHNVGKRERPCWGP
jgi:hypothetical protein